MTRQVLTSAMVAAFLCVMFVMSAGAAEAKVWVTDVQSNSLVLHWSSGHGSWKVCYKTTWQFKSICNVNVFYTSDTSRLIIGLGENEEYTFEVSGKHEKRNKYPHSIGRLKVTTTATGPGGGNPVVGGETLWPVTVGTDCITMGWEEPDPSYHRVLLCYSRARTGIPLILTRNLPPFWSRCVDVLGTTTREVCAEISAAKLYNFWLEGFYLDQSQPPQIKHRLIARKRVATEGAGKREDDEVSCRWTPWLNRDLPFGFGDFESLVDFITSDQACPAPLEIQCRTVEGEPVTDVEQPYTCDPRIGGVCDNRELAPGQECPDYEVRFCC